MKNLVLIIFIISLLRVSIYGQPDKFPGSPEEARKKIEELEKIKLMEILDLKEDVMLKFFSRRKEFFNKMQELEKQKDESISQLIKSKDEENDQLLKKRIDEINLIEENMAKNKIEFINSLSNILTNQQIAKVIIFERSFRHELREMIIKHRKGRPIEE